MIRGDSTTHVDLAITEVVPAFPGLSADLDRDERVGWRTCDAMDRA